MPRRKASGDDLTFPIVPAPETRRLAAMGAGGQPYRFVVVKADGTIWTGEDEDDSDIGVYMQRASAERHAKRTTALLYNVVEDRIEIVGSGKWPTRVRS